MFLRTLRAIIFMGFIAIVMQSLAGYLSRKFNLENSYTEFHLTASLLLGFLTSYLYKNGLAYSELKEEKNGKAPR
jgi:hypothetical protein